MILPLEVKLCVQRHIIQGNSSKTAKFMGITLGINKYFSFNLPQQRVQLFLCLQEEGVGWSNTPTFTTVPAFLTPEYNLHQPEGIGSRTEVIGFRTEVIGSRTPNSKVTRLRLQKVCIWCYVPRKRTKRKATL